ncbi:MAG: GNAT family N-acetyltransferase [Oscillospiraceae bacterium]|jgi:ribosomal-protein-alanine N-acetyltransferase|nr:GNAT family N-acetyltransferase [Oscillospiraceae bacterium]
MIRPIGTQAMETSRLVLRRFAKEDGAAVYRGYASDPQVCRYLSWNSHEEAAVSQKIVDYWVRQYDDPYCFRWAIVMKREDILIGGIDVVELDREAGEGIIGYCIGQGYWGRGITSEALHAMLVYLFTQAGFSRIRARHDSRNPASGSVLLKNGFQFVREEQVIGKEGEPVTCRWYEINQSEFGAI